MVQEAPGRAEAPASSDSPPCGTRESTVRPWLRAGSAIRNAVQVQDGGRGCRGTGSPGPVGALVEIAVPACEIAPAVHLADELPERNRHSGLQRGGQRMPLPRPWPRSRRSIGPIGVGRPAGSVAGVLVVGQCIPFGPAVMGTALLSRRGHCEERAIQCSIYELVRDSG